MDESINLPAALHRLTARFMTIFVVLLLSAAGLSLIFVAVFHMNESVDLDGAVEPMQYAIVRPELAGIVKAVHVSDGDHVTKGQVLAEIEDKELRSNQQKLAIDVEITRNELDREKQELVVLKTGIQNAIERANLQVNQAQMELQNQIAIWKSEQEILGAKVGETNSSGSSEPIAIRLKRVGLEQASLALREASQRPAEVELKISAIGNLERNLSKSQYDLLLANLKLECTALRAPCDGQVIGSELDKLLGTYVTEGASLFMIGDCSGWTVRVAVPERDLPKISPGMEAKLSFDAYPYEKYRILSGRLTELSASPAPVAQANLSVAVAAPRLYSATVTITDSAIRGNNSELKLYVGLHSRVKIITRRDRILNVLLDKLFSVTGKTKKLPVDLVK